jgi:uncharacterized protein DUF3237
MTSTGPASSVAKVEHEYVCSYWATLSPPEVIGPVAEGIRVNFYVTAGEVSGPKMRGRLRPVGGDWLLVRNDGVGVLDVRATMELDNGAIVYTTYGGLLDLGPNGHNLFLQGILPPRVDLRIVPRYYTSHPDYLWLNRLQCVGVGVFDRDQLRVSYDIYALR